MTDKLPMPITDEQIDAAYRDVWSTVPHAQRLSAFARKIAAEAVRLEREATDALLRDCAAFFASNVKIAPTDSNAQAAELWDRLEAAIRARSEVIDDSASPIN